MRLFTLTVLFLFSSFSMAESGLLIKYFDDFKPVYVKTGTSYTLEELEENTYSDGGFKSACYYGSPQDIKEIIEEMTYNSQIITPEGNIVPTFDENDELIENQVLIKANNRSVKVLIEYNYADESLYNINLNIKSCK